MWMNQRFAAIMPPPGQEYENHYHAGRPLPFSYATTTDHLTGKKDGIAKRPDTDPLIIQTDTATEYWQRRGSLTLTDTQGNDVAMPANVRVYLWASTQHYADPLMKQPPRGICVYPANVVWSSMLFRATLDMMDRWASGKGEPPPSKVPSRKDGTLVTAAEWRQRYPTIPGAIVPKGPSHVRTAGFRSGRRARPAEGAPGRAQGQALCGAGAGYRCRRQRRARHPRADGAGAARHL